MKNFLIPAAALALLITVLSAVSVKALFDSLTASAPPPLPTAEEYQAATRQSLDAFIAKDAWCMRATIDAPEEARAVIYYARDEKGRCVPAFNAGR